MTDLKDASRDIAAASVRADFARRDMSSVQQELEKALAAHFERSPIKSSGAWLFVNIGVDGKGEVHGMFGLGGTNATLMLLGDYVADQIEQAIVGEGGCTCSGCKIRALTMILEEEVTADAPRH